MTLEERQKKKRIAILAGPLDNQHAGVHVYARELIYALASNREHLNNEYILIREQRSNDFPELESIVVPIIRWLPGYATLRLFFVVPLVCIWLKVDAVVELAHFGPFNLPKKIKRITVIHDLTPILFPEFHTFYGYFLHKIFLKGILRRADLIITNSNCTKKDIEKIYPFGKEKSVTIYLGVSKDISPKEDLNVLEKYAIRQPYFLFTGTIEPRKNLIFLLDSFELFKSEDLNDWRLVIAGGKGWKSESFYEKYEKHPFKRDIILTGYIPKEELPVFYSMAETFIYPSIYEGFGLPVIEAMACGKNCIVSDTSSLTEIAGDVAEKFNLDSKLELYQKMVLLSKDKTSRKKKDIESQKYSTQFSWIKCCNSFDKEINKLIKS